MKATVLLIPSRLRTEFRHNPLGLDNSAPRFCWTVESDERGQHQRAYQIIIASTPEILAQGEGDVWDSGLVRSTASQHTPYEGPPLAPKTRYWWRVRVWDKNEQPSAFSEPAMWSMGPMSEDDWAAAWIGYDEPPSYHLENARSIPPCPFLRTTFQVDNPVASAMVYATALGCYELRLNSRKIGDDVFAPGWTDFRKRVYYQAYDVTDEVFPGENTLGIVLGHGWYSGYIGFNKYRGEYGLCPRARAQLELNYEDGSRQLIATGPDWRATHGPLLQSDLLVGEQYDARRELHGWDRPSYDDTAWDSVAVTLEVHAAVQSYRGAPTRAHEELKPTAITEPKPGVYIFDMGQNLAGHVRLSLRGEEGTKATLRFGEALQPDGTLYTENLRGARATDEYWLRGAKKEVWAPRFTYHGFRYVELAGLAEPPDEESVRGVVLQADAPQTGQFECDSPMVNRLWSNILWSQRANTLEVPTDCPQRDERLGWMGDALIFAPTACFNMDMAAFYTKWLQDVLDAQNPETGAFSDVAPRACVLEDGAPGWGDAGVFVPWTVYQHYGDRMVLEHMYPGMKRWIAYMRDGDGDGVRRNRLNNAYGDWLSLEGGAPIELIATAFYHASTERVAEIAAILGRDSDAAEYRALAEAIKAAFVEAFVREDGQVEGNSQTAHVLALHFGLLPPNARAKAAERLVNNLRDRDWHLATGFLGTAYLLPVLTNAGYTDVAYRLLLNETYPSWGYTIRNGATTVWERWDGWTEENSFQDPNMNSFNHYALGAVGEWLYRYMAGIDYDPSFPSFKRFVIKPHPGGGLARARAAYESIQGLIESAWEHADGRFTLRVRIPANTRAMIHVPTDDAHNVREGGDPAMDAEGLTYKGSNGGYAIYAARSGEYQFTSDKA